MAMTTEQRAYCERRYAKCAPVVRNAAIAAREQMTPEQLRMAFWLDAHPDGSPPLEVDEDEGGTVGSGAEGGS